VSSKDIRNTLKKENGVTVYMMMNTISLFKGILILIPPNIYLHKGSTNKGGRKRIGPT